MKILHLYHDIMNLYGDYANVAAMRRMLEKSGENVTVDRLSLADTAVLEDYDFIYIGSGTENKSMAVLGNELPQAFGGLIIDGVEMTGRSTENTDIHKDLPFLNCGKYIMEAGGKARKTLQEAKICIQICNIQQIMNNIKKQGVKLNNFSENA